jgi:hypothetical protein
MHGSNWLATSKKFHALQGLGDFALEGSLDAAGNTSAGER